MKDVKMPTSDSYRPYKIASLKDIKYAAAYITAILAEKNPEPELLQLALTDVIEAWVKSDRISESTKQLHEKLDRILTESNATEIYTFVQLLNELGFQLTITPKETQS
jgi:DNA-binding phage protein